jgi:signal transduction histidine kinase
VTAADDQLTSPVHEGWTRKRQPLSQRRAVAEVVTGGAFVAAAVCLAVFADADRALEWGHAVALVALFAAGIRVQIDAGVGYTTPTQLAFVPMLFVLPTPAVPLLVLLAWSIGRLPDLRGRDAMHPDRMLLVPADCWFSLGPAFVLVLFDAQTAQWSDWPIYLLALVAQFACEAASGSVRERLGEGARSAIVSRELGLVWGIDALLSPLGLLAVFATDNFEYSYLLLAPPVILLGFYARERTRRLENALALAETARDRQHLIAGASHELVTPLAVLLGLTDRLATSGDRIDGARRAQIDAVMRREVLALKQVVRQFVDYTRIKTERELTLRPEPVELGGVVASVVVALESSGRLTLSGTVEAPPALIDPDRAEQMVTALAAIALEGSDEAQVALAGTETDVVLTVTTPAAPPARPFAEGGEGSAGGLGLYVTRELARHQGGEVTAEPTDDGGARYTLIVPRA